jgi:hypothetical protein
MVKGGYSQKYTYSAKEGGLLEWKPSEILEWAPNIDINDNIPQLEDGDELTLLEWAPSLPDKDEYP